MTDLFPKKPSFSQYLPSKQSFCVISKDFVLLRLRAEKPFIIGLL